MNFVKESVIKAPPERVFAFHELTDAIDRLIPPWETAKILQRADISEVGSQAIVETKMLGVFTWKWVAEHTAYDPPRSFEDIQVSGPFRSWRHRHVIEEHPEGSVLRDEIEYEMPIPVFGPLAAPIGVTPRLEKLFDYRHKVTKEWAESQK